MLSPEVLESIPLAILTGLGAYGGFPRPPYWWARLSRFRVMQFITLWILIYQGGGKEHLIITTVVAVVIFAIMEISKAIEGEDKLNYY